MLPTFLRCSQARNTIFLFLLMLTKNVAVLSMLANACKDHSSPLLALYLDGHLAHHLSWRFRKDLQNLLQCWMSHAEIYCRFFTGIRIMMIMKKVVLSWHKLYCLFCMWQEECVKLSNPFLFLVSSHISYFNAWSYFKKKTNHIVRWLSMKNVPS